MASSNIEPTRIAYRVFTQPCENPDQTKNYTEKLVRDLGYFEDDLKKEMPSMIKAFNACNKDQLERCLQNYGDGRVDINSVSRIHDLCQKLWYINEPNKFIKLQTMNQLFGAIQCTLYIVYNLKDPSQPKIGAGVSSLERLGTYLILDGIPWYRLPVDELWNRFANILSITVQVCTDLIKCKIVRDVRRVQLQDAQLVSLMEAMAKSANSLPPTEEDIEEIEKEKVRKKKKADVKRWLENLAKGLGIDRHGAVSTSRLKGTGNWFLETTNQWLSEAFVPILWVKGRPGVGKSVLASLFIDHVSKLIPAHPKAPKKESPSGEGSENTTSSTASREHDSLVTQPGASFRPRALAYVYFAYDERENQSITQVYAQLLLQLFDTVSAVNDHLQTLKDDYESLTQKSARGIWEADLPVNLRNMISKLPQNVVLVMDALDEAPVEVYKDIQLLVKEMSEDSPKTMLLSRPHSELEKTQLKSGLNMKALLIDSERSDMEAYIRDALQRDQGFAKVVQRKYKKSRDKQKETEAFYSEVCEAVIHRSQNTFISTEFRVKDICLQKTIGDIRRSANNNSADSGKIYQQAWERISPTDRSLAKRVIGWLTFAKRTLNVDELLEAVVVQPGNYMIEEDEMVFPEDIEKVCNSLVVYDESNKKRLRLAHQTVQEYFADHVDFRDMKAQVCYSCFTYIVVMVRMRHPTHLNTSETSSDTEDDDEDPQFSRHSSLDLTLFQDHYHVEATDSSDDDYLVPSIDGRSLARDMCNFDPRGLISWPRDLTPWCNPEFGLSNYVGGYALAHLKEITIDTELRQILDVLCREYCSLRRPTGLATQFSNPSIQRLNILHLGVYMGDLQLLQSLQKHPKADPNAKDGQGKTALMWALYFEKPRLAEFLLDNGADANVLDGNGYSAAMYATHYHQDDIISRLLKETAQRHLNSPDLLIALTLSKNVRFVETLMQHDIDLDRISENRGQNALHVCAIMGDLEILNILLRKGANPLITCSRGRTPLWYSISHEREDEFETLMKVESNRESTSNLEETRPTMLADDEGVTPLHLAAHTDWSANVIDALLQGGADPTAEDCNGELPLHWAVRRRRNGSQDEDRIIRKIKKLASDSRLLTKPNQCKTAIRYAAEHLSMSVMECLLELSGLSITSTIDAEGTTLLKVAMEYGNLSMIKSIIEQPNVDLSGTIAVSNRDDVVKRCCESEDGLKEFEMLTDTKTWFLHSTSDGKPYRTAWGDTALHSAVMGVSVDLIKDILEMPGFSVTDRNVCGETALHVAARDGNPRIAHEIVEMLLENSEDPDIARRFTNGGKTALDFALERGVTQVIAALVRPSHNACVGLPWDEETSGFSMWIDMPWYKDLRDIVRNSPKTLEPPSLTPPHPWERQRSITNEEISVTWHSSVQPCVVVEVPDSCEVYRVVFRTVSHDQGWSNENEVNKRTKGTYFGSRTWFEVGVSRGEDSKDIAERRNVQSNVHADRSFRQHTVIWDMQDNSPGIQQWLQGLKGRDRIMLFPRAYQALWRHYVKEAEITIWCLKA
ncbi:hypothetical protein H9Q70_010968 [Fusarium xylarioides]|nr:hypothetical protein H9Q70_010968 [Fusarium xylarioides]